MLENVLTFFGFVHFRSRFQLFGDTMNTAARIESTGSRGRIHVSSETAALLRKAGKSSWLTEREDKVFAKGKGLLTTFWLSPRGDDTRTTSEAGSESGSGDYQDDCMANKEGRLIKWVCDELSNQLKLIKAKNVEQGKANKAAETMRSTLPDIKRADCVTVLEEVQEIIHLPHFESDLTVEIEEVELGTRVEEQLTAYVTAIAAMYRNNPFHNFEHAR